MPRSRKRRNKFWSLRQKSRIYTIGLNRKTGWPTGVSPKEEFKRAALGSGSHAVRRRRIGNQSVARGVNQGALELILPRPHLVDFARNCYRLGVAFRLVMGSRRNTFAFAVIAPGGAHAQRNHLRPRGLHLRSDDQSGRAAHLSERRLRVR